jgi:predicted O-methyltransferase YrrM
LPRSRDATTAGSGREPVSLSVYETGELLLGYSAAALERLLGRPPACESIGWEDAVREMEGRFGGAAEVLREPALAEIERETRLRLEVVRDEDPAGRRWPVDSMLARFCYLVCRLTMPEAVLETGVAYGASSAFILKALAENGRGMLYSVDLPPLGRDSRRFWRVLVGEDLEARWDLQRGSGRRVLPGLLDEIGTPDLFLHDSLHTRWNMRREFGMVWPRLKTGGMLIADDIERNGEFDRLRSYAPSYTRVISDVEKNPLSGSPAPTTFGIAIK